jgi:hypothetical protein
MISLRQKVNCFLWLAELKSYSTEWQMLILFVFQEPVVTDDTFLSMENTVLLHVPVGKFSQLDGAPHHFSRCVIAFLDREFPDRCIERRGPKVWMFSFEGLSWKVQNVYELRDRIVRAADCVTNEMLANTCTETEYRFDVCCATSGTHTEMYRAHKELCEVQCLKMCRFLQCTLWLKIRDLFCFILFYCHLRPGTP